MLTAILIDDEILTPKSIKKMLERHEELEVTVIGMFTDAQTALRHLEVEKPDLAIVDIRMPNMDGIQLMQFMRERKIDTEVIVLSAHREFEYAQQALEHGAVAYLTKPLDDADLIKAVSQARTRIEEQEFARRLGKRLAQMQEKDQMRLLREISEKAAPDGPPDSDGVIEKAKEYCQQHFAQEIDLQQVADYVCMNRNYFCDFFKKNTGQHFSEYLTLIRMEKAKELLLKTEYRSQAIAALCGYKNSSHFGRVFKAFTGMTPKEYRRMLSLQNNE